MLLPLKKVRVRKRRRSLAAVKTAAKPSRGKRRGATAMEYAVVLSLIFVVVFVAIQHLGSVLGTSLTNSAQKVPSGQ